MATWIDDITSALESLGGTGTYAEIYAEVANNRPSRPQSWKQIIQRQVQDHSSDSMGYKGGRDLFFSVDGLGNGVWGLRALTQFTPVAFDLPAGDEAPGRASHTTYRVLRDTRLAREVKLLHRDHCQLCDLAIQLTPSRTYAEAHHVIPLGREHNGPDVPGNIMVLCPNHHAMLDLGAIPLSRADIQAAPGHLVSDESIEYHNARIWGATDRD